MLLDRLERVQYVRLAPGAAEAVARYLDAPAGEISELVVDAAEWPEDVLSAPLRAQNGLLLAGDPLLLDATDAGLVLAACTSDSVLLPWHTIERLDVLGA